MAGVASGAPMGVCSVTWPRASHTCRSSTVFGRFAVPAARGPKPLFEISAPPYSRIVRVQVNDVRLFFDVEGAGLVIDGPNMRERPTVVLLSGGPGFDHTVFKPSYSQLADVAQIIYLDLRGHGRSDRGDPTRWTVDVWAGDVRNFCDAVAIEHPVVLGWSFGGTVAMAYAARNPDHPAKLVLQSTMARLDIELIAEGFRRVGGDDAAEVARSYWSGGGPDALAAYGATCAPLYGPSLGDPDAAARALLNLDLFSDPGSVMRGVNLIPELASVTCPTLVVAGEVDPVCTLEAATEIVAALPKDRVRFERFAGAGHHVHRDDPTRFFTLLRDFLVGRAPIEVHEWLQPPRH